MNQPTFTHLPPDDRGYSGMTRLQVGDRHFAAMGVGPEVEAALIERAARERQGLHQLDYAGEPLPIGDLREPIEQDAQA